jgi:MFS family permease
LPFGNRIGGGPRRSPTLVPALLVVLFAFLFNFVARGVADAYTVFLVPIEQETGWPRSTLTSVYALYMLVQGLAAPISGMAFERFGPRVVYPAGLVLLALATLGGSMLEARWQLYLCLGIVTGLGVAAIGMIPAAALIGRWHRRHLGTAIAIAYAGFGSGILVIAPLAQLLIERLGWRGAYQAMGLLLAALALPVLLLPWRRLADGRPAEQENGGATPVRRAGTGWRLPEAMRTLPFWGLVHVLFFTAFGMYIVIVQVVAMLVESGYPPIEAAAAFGSAGMLSVAGVIAAGGLCDRIGFRTTALASFAGTLAGILCLIGLYGRPSPILLAGYTLLFGIAQGARGPIVSTLTSRIFVGGSATIFGSIYATMSIGAALGAWLSGLLHDITQGYGASLVVAAAAISAAPLPFLLSPAIAGAIPAPPPLRAGTAITAKGDTP